MNKDKKTFGYFEQSILDNLKNVLFYYYEKLKSFLSQQSYTNGGISRVLGGTGTTSKPQDYDESTMYDTFIDFSLSEFGYTGSSGFSILLIIGLILLVALVVFVTLYVLQYYK